MPGLEEGARHSPCSPGAHSWTAGPGKAGLAMFPRQCGRAGHGHAGNSRETWAEEDSERPGAVGVRVGNEPLPPISPTLLETSDGVWRGGTVWEPQNFISFPKPVPGQPFPAKFLPEAN